jgi:hypothetical protein
MHARTVASVGIAATLVAALAGCASASASPTESSASRSVAEGSWTVLTYSIADTNLEPFMMTDLEELGQVGTQEGLNLVALVDRSEEYTDEPVLGLKDWSGAKLIEIGEGTATVLEDQGDINTGDPDVLAEFIAEGIRSYPAEHYSLIISDHGASWPGVGADGSSGNDTLTLAELHDAIGRGLDGSGVGALDILGFDACLMATYEVASTLAPLADRLIASQELEPGHGWNYESFGVITEGATTPDEVGSAIIDGFEQQAKDEGTDSDITLSMVDLTRMSEVDAALEEFTGILVDSAAGIGPTVGRTLADTLGFGQSPDPNQDTHMADLAGFTSQLGVELLFAADAADDVTRAINDVVLDRVAGQATRGATGLSIYFPPTVTYFDEDYRDLPKTGGWQEFLTAYYGVGDAIEQGPVLADGAQITLSSAGATITGSFDSSTAQNLAEAYIRYGVLEADGSVTFLGEQDAELGADGGASGTYDLSTLTLSDGYDTVSAYLSLFGNGVSDIVTADIPLQYYSPDGEDSGELVLSATIDATTGETLSAVFYVFDEESGTYGEFDPESDWIIVPVVPNVMPDGTEEWLLTTDVGLYADLDRLVYDLTMLDPGTQVYLELVVIDYGGNSDSVSGTVTVPLPAGLLTGGAT